MDGHPRVPADMTTKTFNPMSAGADRGWRPNGSCDSCAGVAERLGVETIDLYLCHEFDPLVPLRETFAASRTRGGRRRHRLRGK